LEKLGLILKEIQPLKCFVAVVVVVVVVVVAVRTICTTTTWKGKAAEHGRAKLGRIYYLLRCRNYVYWLDSKSVEVLMGKLLGRNKLIY